MSSDLTLLNYLNVLAYICNAGVTYTIGANVDASIKFQTLVTPVGYAFSIWAAIFTAELVFVIGQLLPAYRSSRLVTNGVGYNFIGACLAQAAWCPTFSIYENTLLALLFMVAILIFLVTIVRNQHRLQEQESDTSTALELLILKFPFAIHCGWIAAASLVSINVTLVAFHVGATAQYIVAILSLILIVAVSGFCIGILFPPLYVIPSVLAWASLGIFAELGNPKDLVVRTFDVSRIQSVRLGALVTCILIVAAITVKTVFDYLASIRRARRGAAVEEPLLTSE
ncbi:hypothetical protein MHU86_9444 [Fragilaria crotonensis]|nr:hypothetical protein MHU86_9444 [Fragilaria crotonensis]